MMDKAKLFLVALAPAALIVPMEVQAAETSIVKITGNNIEGAELTADTSLIPADKIIANYQWYYEGLDTNGDVIHTEIPGGTASKLTIPSGATNKAIIVKVTTQDGTEYLSGKVVVNNLLPTNGETFVNGKVYAEINNTVGNPVVMKSYQWYYFENGKKTPINGATNIELAVPPEAAGKFLVVEAKSEVGESYTSNPIKIDELQLNLDPNPPAPLKIKGYTPEKFVVPGDTLTVVNPTVKDNGRDLKADQISYAYQWMYELEGSYSFITGATGATYTIPVDALDKKINKIVVRVIVTVGTTVADSPSYSEVVEVANNPADGLITSIEDLLAVSSDKAIIYKSTGIQQFGSELENLMNKYTALTAAAKANVTNYDILKRAVDDYQLVKTLKDKIVEAQNLDNPAKLQKFKALEAEYTKLDLLQRSIDNTIYLDIQAGLGTTQHSEISEVMDINKEILGLLDDLTGPSFSLVKYKDPIPELQKKMKEIEDRIANLSSEYKAIVQNQDILKTAKADIKKVQAFLDKANKIDITASAKKQVAAAKSIRTAYEKLNVKQQSLVPDTLFDMDSNLMKAESSEVEEVSSVQDVIDKYITLEPILSYNGILSTDDTKEINKSIATYKTLTKDNAKKITGYTELVKLQKDIKTAEKVVAQIEKYKLMFDTEGTKYSKVNSTYKSTMNAFNKLTTLQKSLVNNSDKLTPPLDSEQKPNDKPLSEAEEKAKELGTAFVFKIEQVLVPSNDFVSYAKEIEKLSSEYKNTLSSAARKYVTNYDALKAVEKDVKTVQSFLKKVDAADLEGDVKKRYTKIQSIQKSYLNLSANQQILADMDETFKKLVDSLTDETIYTNLAGLDERIANLVDGNVSIDEIKELEGMYKKLSTAEQKKIINYSILKQAIADVKKVDSFISQYNKMLENPAKNIQSVIKAFNALTAQQANLVPSEIQNEIIKIEKEQRESNDLALDLVDRINGLVVSGKYVSGLEKDVNDLRRMYSELSTAQQSLVKNYSKLTKAESDLAKVAEVRALEEAITTATENDKGVARKAWQSAFNKLSNQLEDLYLDKYPTRTE
ncbi:hypothetical protein ACIQXF_06475 [Lysinibacillus sp. NPDC097231]|uniref:hypothetical protein n=1 Tax=Lysinibacillus sp. NPDC097231 TaxID=3364142 RepID=UPI0037FC77EE